MKTLRLSLLLCILPWLARAQAGTDSLVTKGLPPADLQSDFRYLRRLLEETHPGLYRYTPRVVMQARLDSIEKSLNQPQPFYQFFKTVSGLLADIRCAHTHALPHGKWREQFRSNLKTIPFFLVPFENRSYVIFNGTEDARILPGSELLSINGQSMDAIRQQVFRYHWTDGYIETAHAPAMRGELFSLFYYWYIGQPEVYALTFRSPNGDTLQLEAPGKPFGTSIQQMVKNPINKQMMAWYNGKKARHPWRLSFPEELPNTAYLRLDEFGGEGAKNGEQAITVFRKFMDKTMAQLTKKNVQHLVVDLRSNRGGWDSQGIELFTYLMKGDSAVPYYARQHSVTDSSEFLRFSDLSEADRKNVKNELIPEPDGTFTLKQGSDTREPKRYGPKPNRFRGQVYILMNGESVSTASEFLAVAHANRVGVFIGEESGGAYEGGNGSSFINLTLPRSGIQVSTPLVYYRNAVPEPAAKGRGTLPDYPAPVTVQNLLEHTDNMLPILKKLIQPGMVP